MQLLPYFKPDCSEEALLSQPATSRSKTCVLIPLCNLRVGGVTETTPVKWSLPRFGSLTVANCAEASRLAMPQMLAED